MWAGAGVLSCLGFERVLQGLGFRVWGLGFGDVEGLGSMGFGVVWFRVL